jgi:hypothetical protein
MTSNPNFADYVECVQENLAVFSLPDEVAKKYLRESKPLAIYNPRPISFEILFNERGEAGSLARKFDPHISDRLFEQSQLSTCLIDLKRFYDYANNRAGIPKQENNPEVADLTQLNWSVPEHVSSDEYLSQTTKDSLKQLPQSIRDLGQLYDRLKEVNPEGIKQREKDNLPLAPQLKQDLENTKKILINILKRYEVEYFPTNLGTAALVYEAWKEGKLIPLGNPEEDEKTFDSLIAGLFISAGGKGYETLLEDMATSLGLKVRHVGNDKFRNEKPWIRNIEGLEWLPCVESALIHRVEKVLTDNTFRYLIHYPLIIDDYWFAGIAMIYSDLNFDPGEGDIPEIFNSKKYAKIYNTIKTVSDTLKLSLREDALKKAEQKLRDGDPLKDVFLEVVRDYFVCFNVRRIGEPNDSLVLTEVVYEDPDIQIYGPRWLKDEKLQAKLDLIRNEIEGYDVGVRRVPGLRKTVTDLASAIQKEQEKGQDRQARKFSHQAAGLMQTVRRDRGVQDLEQNTRASLWHLDTLIQIWGTLDLEPHTPITASDFPEWRGDPVTEIMAKLVNFSLEHALGRAEFLRSDAQPVDRQVQKVARQLLNQENPVDAFKQELGLAAPLCDWPDWAINRGFVLCFHHVFWQAAYHGLRAKCGLAAPLAGSSLSYVQVFLNGNEVQVINAALPLLEEPLQPFRDAAFFEDVNDRLNKYFTIRVPGPQNGHWITTITKLC